MPNWCHNKITLSHDDPAQIERVKAHKDNVLQEFIPCPQELLDGEGWYDWRVNNWGTKWDIALDITRERARMESRSLPSSSLHGRRRLKPIRS